MQEEASQLLTIQASHTNAHAYILTHTHTHVQEEHSSISHQFARVHTHTHTHVQEEASQLLTIQASHDKLLKEVKQYEEEFQQLKNQDVTIRRLEERILSLEVGAQR
jgi:hypothetical protein